MSIGTTRNLTSLFVKYRLDAQRVRKPEFGFDDNDRPTRGLLDEHRDVELGTLGAGPDSSPAWLQKCDLIKAEMVDLKDKLSRLQELHSKALLVNFSGGENESRLQAATLTYGIQRNFKALDDKIRSLGQQKGGDAQVRQQVQRQLAQALFKLSVEFRKEEMRFLNKVEQQKGYGVGSALGLVEADDEDPGFTQSQALVVDQSNALIAERDEEIQKIVASIAELAQIMRDLSVLVVEQGTMLDRIDHQVQDVAVKVEQGVKELEKASRTQKTGQMMICITTLIVIIVLLIIVIVIRHI